MQMTMDERLHQLTRFLEKEASGRVQELKIESVEDGLIVYCRARHYYGLQVILAALNERARSEQDATPMRLCADVNGQHFDLPIERAMPAAGGNENSRRSVMVHRNIVVTERDLRGLRQMLRSEFAAMIVPEQHLNDLRGELDRAEIVATDEVTDDVVKMESTVVLRDMDTGEEETFTLVYPQRANIARKRLSVLAPVGTAILGYRTGDVVRWKVPDGYRRLQIERVLDRPQ
jgi:regulator of nucleoside diphosphate kinase